MTPLQCRVARAGYLGWTFDELARRLRGKATKRTLINFETGARKPQAATAAAVEAALTAAGIVFDPDGVNVRLEAKAKGRKQ